VRRRHLLMGDAAIQMINNNVHCALRTQRRTWGLSQRELAELLGMDSRAHVSRIEHGKRTPTMETALSCSTLFGVPLSILFPQAALEIEERLRERLSRFARGATKTTTLAAERKRELCTRALADLSDEAHDDQV
jgi:transcriptional regulator with XRE-family HTH domain